MKKVLIIGASGLLGSTLYRELSQNFLVTGTYYSNRGNLSDAEFLNLSDSDSIDELLNRLNPDYVINCAGLTNVEICERLPEKAMLLNSIFPGELALRTAIRKIPLVHISTDHFENVTNEIRNESMSPIPTNRYGYSKFSGEKLVLNSNPNALVLRTNFFGLNSSSNHSILDFALSSLKIGGKVNGFTDVFFSPIGVTSFAQTLLKILDLKLTGLLNLCGTASVSKFAFLRMVASAMDIDSSSITPTLSSSQLGRAKRPLLLSLDNSLLLDLVGELPTLEIMIDQELRKTSKY